MTAFLEATALPWLGTVVLAALPVLGAALIAWLRRRGVDARVTDALQRAGGLAYHQLVTSGADATDAAAVERAVAAAGATFLRDLPEAATRAGLTPQAVAEAVRGELGRLLAADPTVSARGAPPVACAGVVTLPVKGVVT